MLPTRLLVFFLLSGLISGLQASEPLSLKEAVDQKVVAYRLRGLGGYQGQALKIELKNLTRQVLNITLPPGQVFASEDSNLQDLILTREEVMVLQPQAVEGANLFTMCTQSGNMSPGQGARFRMGDMARDDLYDLAQIISKNSYQNSTAQSAVWSVANGDPVRFIFGADTVMVRELASFVSESRDIPLSEFRLEPIPQVITDIRASIEMLLEEYAEDLSLQLETGTGEVIRRYFEKRKHAPGFRQYKVGASYAHPQGEEFELFLVLREGDRVLQKKLVRPGEAIPEMQRLNAQAILTFEAEQDLNGRLGVYDQNGTLYFLIQDKKPIAKGHHYTRVLADTYLPPHRSYQVRLVHENQILAQAPISNEATPPVVYSKAVVRGILEFELKEVAKDLEIGLYDEAGRLKRRIAEIQHLNPGKRAFRYQFEHRDGPAARFYVRLVNAKGQVLAETCATCE